MEFLKNMFTPIQERIKSPLYSTLIISWLVCNWKIWVALFFYNETINGIDKITYISNQISNYLTMYVIPLLAVIVYLYIIPFIDFEVFRHYESNKNKKQVAKLKLLEKSMVSGKTYTEVLKEKNSLEDSLGKIISDNKEKETEAQKLSDENVLLMDTNRTLQEALTKINTEVFYRNNLRQIMSGHWSCSYVFDKSKKAEYEIFYLTIDNKWAVMDKNIEKIYFEIDFIDITPNTGKIQFLKIEVEDKERKRPKRILKVSLQDTSTNSIKRYFGTEVNLLDPENDVATVTYQENR